MEKGKRIVYLDFIRVISMILIVTYHFFVHLSGDNGGPFKFFSDSKLGIIGVTMFFMLSGASLIYSYGEKIKLKTYVKKRFLGIYPMFWIAYTAVFLLIFYQNKGVPFNDLPVIKFLPTIFGMDGYFSPFMRTFYLIGEWFLGCIVLIYILFPLFRYLMNKIPKTFFTVSTIVNLAVFILYKKDLMPLNMNLIVNAYAFILGMYLFKYHKNFKLWEMLIAFVIVVAVFVVPFNEYNMVVFRANVIGYFLFIVLAYIGTLIRKEKIQVVIINISKYSYAIFLVHHYIIMKMISTFQGIYVGKKGAICLYITVWITIGIFAKILYKVNGKIIKFFTTKKELKENDHGKNI